MPASPLGVNVGCSFFFNDTATTEIYTLSLHDALPICRRGSPRARAGGVASVARGTRGCIDRKSTRLNSSHGSISYAVFCLETKQHVRRSDAIACVETLSINLVDARLRI